MYCDNKGEVKQCIRQGGMAWGNRGIGKTQAILEIIHEDHGGVAVLVLPTESLMRITMRRYREAYPGDALPIFCTAHNLEKLIRGRSFPVYVDTYDLFNHEDTSRIDYVLRGHVIGAF